MDKKDFANIWASNERHLILTLTRGCNLRCSYCYEYGEDGESILVDRGVDYMSLETAIEIIDDVNPNIIRFYGGEPLLRSRLIMQIMDRYPDIHYQINTNGLLYSRLPDEYWARMFSVELSIDGVDDTTRTENLIRYYHAIDAIRSKVIAREVIICSTTISQFDSDYSISDRVIDIYNRFDINVFQIGLDMSYGRDILQQANMNQFIYKFTNELIQTHLDVISGGYDIMLKGRDQVFAAVNGSVDCSSLNGEYSAIDVDGTVGSCHVALATGVDISEYNEDNISYACPYVKATNSRLSDALDNNGQYLDICKTLEEVNKLCFITDNKEDLQEMAYQLVGNPGI